jgi:PilZ domain
VVARTATPLLRDFEANPMNATATAGELLFSSGAASSSAPDPSLVQFAQGLPANDRNYGGEERRSELRYSLGLNVLAIPSNDNHGQAGEPLIGVTRDISASGISLLVARPIEAGWLAVQLGDPRGGQVRMIVQVLRSRPLGGYHEIAGVFVARL